MKTKLSYSFLLFVLLSAFANAQGDIYSQPPSPPMEQGVDSTVTPVGDHRVVQLVGPIALYPDPILSILLPALTHMQDLTTLEGLGDGQLMEGSVGPGGFDPSVTALGHYPTLVQWLAQNGQWAQALSDAFLQNPVQVMSAIQDVRRTAQREGMLFSNQEQQVIDEGGTLSILPTQPNALYIPTYDTGAIFNYETAMETERGPQISYGRPLIVGPWLNYGIYWEQVPSARRWQPPIRPEGGAIIQFRINDNRAPDSRGRASDFRGPPPERGYVDPRGVYVDPRKLPVDPHLQHMDPKDQKVDPKAQKHLVRNPDGTYSEVVVPSR